MNAALLRQVLAAALALLAACHGAGAQSRDVAPDDLALRVTLERPDAVPFVQELVLLTVEGVYRRHITLEKLLQPALPDFDWMQLGEDAWFDSVLDGRKVKNFRRRMALFAQVPGRLTIPSFTHELHLTDESDDWFAHSVTSAPIEIEVRPKPDVDGWWLPVSRLTVADSWSNPPDQLAPGEGVLRIVRIEATGVGPEAIPPMPDLRSPSGHVFAHPEKRLIELSPQGPVSIAFWRWTVQPGPRGTAILEPFGFDYFDTQTRQMRHVEITAQRVAHEALGRSPEAPPPPAPWRLSAWPLALAALVGMGGGAAVFLAGRAPDRLCVAGRLASHAARRVRRWHAGARLLLAAWRGDLPALRRTARGYAAIAGDGRPSPHHARCLRHLDAQIFAPNMPPLRFVQFAREMLSNGGGARSGKPDAKGDRTPAPGS
ncbi:BatD family protein [Profundibacterium mesophilum]|uniref:Oxygen tolerance domain containing protein n=1 Tax=Profundibacterium mesophilum KAUST100406-0324 TaxID=1037889 RepID=A0A921TDU3_9RHOB|nr:BatD family protein [Profundibacterium mesophilum]KAF0674699.1 Oxygen tolerance domain containing protein [Profundibacterium mesophilum KAUST100406-0324]